MVKEKQTCTKDNVHQIISASMTTKHCQQHKRKQSLAQPPETLVGKTKNLPNTIQKPTKKSVGKCQTCQQNCQTSKKNMGQPHSTTKKTAKAMAAHLIRSEMIRGSMSQSLTVQSSEPEAMMLSLAQGGSRGVVRPCRNLVGVCFCVWMIFDVLFLL